MDRFTVATTYWHVLDDAACSATCALGRASCVTVRGVLPGSSIFSCGTAGCNLACRFCQNWDISKSKEIDTLADEVSPEAIVRAAARLGCRSVAFTYNDPTIFMECAIDVADACHEAGLSAVAVTAGYICPEPRAELYSHLDAATSISRASPKRSTATPVEASSLSTDRPAAGGRLDSPSRATGVPLERRHLDRGGVRLPEASSRR